MPRWLYCSIEGVFFDTNLGMSQVRRVSELSYNLLKDIKYVFVKRFGKNQSTGGGKQMTAWGLAGPTVQFS